MSQAIVTKFIGPTDMHGPMVKAKTAAFQILNMWDTELTIEANHQRVANRLAKDLGWDQYNTFVGGALPDGSGYAFVPIQNGNRIP